MTDLPLDAPNISAWLDAHAWMRKARRPMDRLLYRVMRAHLLLLSEIEMQRGREPEGKYQKLVGKP